MFQHGEFIEPVDEQVIVLDDETSLLVISCGHGHSDDDFAFLYEGARLLFTGDVLYPGYLYCRNLDSYMSGMFHLHQVASGKFDFSLGSHIEMDRHGQLYPNACSFQPNEAQLEQPSGVLDELVDCLRHNRLCWTKNFALTPTSKMNP